ncbi:MAG TPA: hypothetical protein VJH75_04530 [Patescibacteria group bacterium]|nr:hypothetical protein [Patescibacteria group bacterium]
MSLAKKINLRDGEEILFTFRRYVVTTYPAYLLGLAFIATSMFFSVWLFGQGLWGEVAFGLGLVVGLYIILHTWFFSKNNFLTVTSQRIVDVNRVGWFDEVISACYFREVRDIYVRKKGVFANLFNYGTITIETTNDRNVLQLTHIHDSTKAATALRDEMALALEKSQGKVVEDIYEDFVEIVPELTPDELLHISDVVNERLDELESPGETLEIKERIIV